jgi:hypothetical protein
LSTVLYIKTAKEDILDQLKPRENGYEARICTSTRRLACWTGAWVAATALMTFGPKFFWNKSVVLTLLAVGLNIGVGVGMVLANKNYIAELDELQRKVQVNALAIGLGVGVIAGIPYSVLDMYDVIPFKAEIGHLIMLMGLAYSASFLYGAWRYR